MQQPAPLSRSAAFWYWLKLGFISFGGPAGQIGLMHAELVERRRWISERRFLHALNYCMLLPGPEATQLAVYIGWLLHGTVGGIIAGLLFLLPSLAILTALSWIYLTFGQLPLIAGILYGMKPAVVAIVLGAAWRIGRRSLRNATLITLALLSFVGISLLHLPFPAIIAAAALAGWLGGRYLPGAFQTAVKADASAPPHAPALIDDDSPSPGHARFSWRRLAWTGTAGIALLLLPWLLLLAMSGPEQPLPQMAWFFGKAALLTFGGAYAVLPYVYQGGVAQYHWLSAQQMIDGLALGESTPGPLIMIVAFVGFLGGWQQAALGPHVLLGGLAGAAVAAWFTFLPSFVFILAGAPLVEASRDDLRMTAPLTAIAAAVVGVIASLALFFGRQVCYPSGRWDIPAIVLTLLASLALLRWRMGPIKLLLACAMAGVVLSYPG
jgi:chromate transporter